MKKSKKIQKKSFKDVFDNIIKSIKANGLTYLIALVCAILLYFTLA